MKKLSPDYYNEFMCVAGDCDFTCCKQWEIAVDPATRFLWDKLGIDTTACLKSGISGDIIKLNDNGFCPFFRGDGLCSIVAEHGEESISVTCHTFPREKHEHGDIIEYTLAMGCPEALRLLWNRQKFEMAEVTETDQKNPFEDADKGLLLLRNYFTHLVQNQEFTLEEELRIAFLCALDVYDLGEASFDQIEKLLADLNLAEIHKFTDNIPRDFYDHICEQNEILLDLAENYRNKKIYHELLEPLTALAESFEDEEQKDKFIEDRKKFEGVWLSLENKMRLLFAEEIYSTLYLPAGNSYTVILKLQWLAIFYAALKQALFLAWEKDGKLTDKRISDIVVMLARMTGYSDDDIEEYLENSFEEIIWEWGYFALIV